MVGAGRDRPGTVVRAKGVLERAVPGREVPGMPGRALVAPVTGAPGKADGMGPQEMEVVSRFAVRQAEQGMRFAQAVGANAVPLSGAAAMGNAPMEIAPPAVLLPVIGCTEPAVAQIGPSSVIGPDLSVVLRTPARRIAGPSSAVRLSAVRLTGGPLIAVLAGVLLVVQLVALERHVLGLAGPMDPGLTVAILLPPALRAAEIGQAPGR